MAVLFDTLLMVETLQAGGFTDQQARAMTTALGNAATVAQVATRGDVMDLGIAMKHDFDKLSTDLRHDFDKLSTDVRHEMEVLRRDMTIRLGGIVVTSCTVLGVVLTLLGHFWR